MSNKFKQAKGYKVKLVNQVKAGAITQEDAMTKFRQYCQRNKVTGLDEMPLTYALRTETGAPVILANVQDHLRQAYKELGELLSEDDPLLSFACYEIQDSLADPLAKINRLTESMQHNM